MRNPMVPVIRWMSLFLLIQTIAWVALTIVSMSQIGPNWTQMDYLNWAANPDLVTTANYINATLLTLVVVALFTALFRHLYDLNEYFGVLGFAFIIIYGVLNLACYGIQISLVPSLAQSVLNMSVQPSHVYLLIQADSSTLIGFLNGLAYAVLAIPSILYGRLLMREGKPLSGYSLMLNGLLCIVGIIGYMTAIDMLAIGTMAGGVVFLISLLFMVVEFGR